MDEALTKEISEIIPEKFQEHVLDVLSVVPPQCKRAAYERMKTECLGQQKSNPMAR